ncbi:MAG: DUF3795 domain-containing protein [Oscillospiraceae bacterium]|nr:DUF3795 domain-containing protein [Oscillospiraceae bacterium]
MNLSSCGIDCAACKFTAEKNCPGCHAVKGKPFWSADGDCDLYTCAADKVVHNCGKCSEFPCGMLKQWAESENPERIENLRK